MTRALVLGSGGLLGVGWESGLAVGLADGGVDVGAADAIFGTSAGSFVGAQLALGVDLTDYVAQLSGLRAAVLAESAGRPMAERVEALGTAIATAALSGAPPEEARRSLGRLALESKVASEEEFLTLFALFEGRQWPPGLHCTAVDTTTGELTVWQEGSGADLLHAVASSCASACVYPPVTIGGRRYMDGGLYSPLNADLATGHERVVVVSAIALSLPPGMSNPVAGSLMSALGGELAALRSSGCEVEVIEPNPHFLEISGWGTSLMDSSRAVKAYEAGVRQGVEESQRIAGLWNR